MKKSKDINFVVSLAKDIFNMVMMVIRLVIQIIMIFVNLFKFIFGRCLKRKKQNKISPSKGSEKEIVVYTTDYQTQISRLKNTKESAYYEKYEKILRFYEQNSASIEVEYKERIYFLPFINMPYFRYLPKQNKNEFNDNVDRSSRESKVRSLIFAYEQFKNSAKYTFQTDLFVRRVPVLNVFYDYFASISLINLLLAVAVNILILIAYSSPDAEPETKDNLFEAITDIGWAMVGVTILILLLLLIQNIPEIKDYMSRHDRARVKLGNLWGLFVHSGILYFLVYLCSAFLGLYVHAFFFAFALSDLVNRFPTMKIIFRAVYEPRKSLVLTLLLIVISCYIFALVWYTMMAGVLTNTAALFPESSPALAAYGSPEPFALPYAETPFTAPEEPTPDDTLPAVNCCQNMFDCFVCLMDNLIKNDGKIAKVLAGDHNQKADFPDYYIYAYDNVALIILKFLLFEILAGLIIDTFGALRDLDISKNEDLKGSCFICGLPVEEFERPGCADFETHITKEHYMWNYIAYLSYLTEKDKNDFDGVEQYIYHQMANNSITWIPNGKTFFLDQDTDENIVFDNLESIENNCGTIDNNLQRMKQIMTNIEQVRFEREKEKR